MLSYAVISRFYVFLFSNSFFYNDPAPTEIYTLSLHDALPISHAAAAGSRNGLRKRQKDRQGAAVARGHAHCGRSEEHTSELQSRQYLVCRLLLEKKNKNNQHDLTHLIAYATHN